jgi:hypothetical protein
MKEKGSRVQGVKGLNLKAIERFECLVIIYHFESSSRNLP